MQGETRVTKQGATRAGGRWSGLLWVLAMAVGLAAGAAEAQRNVPPLVSLGASQTSLALGGKTTLTATASDADGSVVRVSFYAGSTLLGQKTAPPYTVDFTPPTVGNHLVSAVAVDNLGAQNSSAVLTIVVAPVANQAPVVSLSAAPAMVQQGGTTTLTATASDPDGSIAKVQFFQGTTLIGQSTSAPYTLIYAPPGTSPVAVKAVAYDNYNTQTTSNTVTINIDMSQGPVNKPPTVTLTVPSTTVPTGTAITLNAAATDPDGTIAKVEFYDGAMLIAADTSAPYSTSYTPRGAGTYVLQARAYDNASASASSNSVTVTVGTAPPPPPPGGGGGTVAPPSITMTLAATGQPGTLVTPGSTITVNATATAATGATVSRVSFYMNGTLLATDTTSPYSTTAAVPTAGNYDFYATVTDSLNQTTTTLVQRAIAQTAPAVASTSADVWRLLNQATFGASQAEAARVNALGIAGWIDDQFTKPVSGYPDAKYNRIQLATSSDCNTNRPDGTGYPADSPQAVCARDHLTLAMVQRDFFMNAVYAPDQLRQRVAWALSQIIVTSANEPDLAYAHVMSRYQNLMFQEAFGNYETLLRKVTYNPAMGNYLDMVNNDRPAGSRVPNENYAREIMQLFSVGLYELNSDGSYLLDANNKPIETYDQTDIAEFSRVFTGYTYASATNQTSATTKQGRYYGAPMVPYPTTATTGHDPNSKTLLNGTVLPANQSAQQDIDAAVRNVFMHPNTPPFVAKQLIQRLVTGNPSPAYVARIAAVFVNNGSGVRGDLRAVVRAILLDGEARGGVKTASDFGQLKEPVLMVTGLIRALSGVTDGAQLSGATGGLGQQPYFSPTVFNYFMPDAKVPGTSIIGPEFGIHTTVTAIGRANLVYRMIWGYGNGYAADRTVPNATGTQLFTQQFESLADNAVALVDRVNDVLAGGQFPAAREQTVVDAVNAITLSVPSTAAQRAARARMAVYLIASSYDYQVQR